MDLLSLLSLAAALFLAGLLVVLWRLYREAARALAALVEQLRAGGPVVVALPGEPADGEREAYLVARVSPTPPIETDQAPGFVSITAGPGGQAVPVRSLDHPQT